MVLLAHIMGAPVEELLPPLTTGATASALLALASIVAAVRHRLFRD